MKMIILALFATISCVTHGFGNARLTVKVIDSESGNPLPGIRVHGGFLNYPRGWGIAAKDNNDEGITDRDGICRLSGNTEAGESCCIVRRNEGYYNSGWYSFDYKERSMLKLGRWLPDDIVVTARLDRVVNPIPLWVGKSRSLQDRGDQATFEDGTTVTYDLMKNDWLPPFGNGVVGDVSFSCRKTVLGAEPHRYPNGIGIVTNVFYRCDVLVRFTGTDNGMIEVLPSRQAGIKLRIAPDEGYVPERRYWTGRMSRTEYKDNFDKNRCYYVRIRTEHDEKGGIKNAIYGKIYGDIKLEGQVEGIRDISFLYYLNPTPNDRNLEWDMKNNLCPKPGDVGNPQP